MSKQELELAQRIIKVWNTMPSSIEKTLEITTMYSKALDIVKSDEVIKSKQSYDYAVSDLLYLHKFAMYPILKEQRRISHKESQAKYRKDKLGSKPRDPDYIPLTKAQQNIRYALTDNGKRSIKKAQHIYYIKKKRQRDAKKSRWS